MVTVSDTATSADTATTAVSRADTATTAVSQQLWIGYSGYGYKYEAQVHGANSTHKYKIQEQGSSAECKVQVKASS